MKIGVLGDASSGKSCLVRRFVEGDYAPGDIDPTCGFHFSKRTIAIGVESVVGEDGRASRRRTAVVQLLDAGGDDRSYRLCRRYFSRCTSARTRERRCVFPHFLFRWMTGSRRADRGQGADTLIILGGENFETRVSGILTIRHFRQTTAPP